MEGRRLGRAACDAKSGIEVKPGGARKEADGWWARTVPSGTSHGGPVRQVHTVRVQDAQRPTGDFTSIGICLSRDRAPNADASRRRRKFERFPECGGRVFGAPQPRWAPTRTAGRRHGDRRVGRMPRSGMIRRPAVPARPAWRRLGVRGAVAANDGRRRPMRRHHAHAEAIRGCARAARQPALSRIATGVSSRARPGVSLQVDATRNASPLAGRRPSGRLSK